jgi:hypothetical protein
VADPEEPNLTDPDAGETGRGGRWWRLRRAGGAPAPTPAGVMPPPAPAGVASDASLDPMALPPTAGLQAAAGFWAGS